MNKCHENYFEFMQSSNLLLETKLLFKILITVLGYQIYKKIVTNI